MSNWPIVRTPSAQASRVRWWQHLLACLAVLVVPTLIGATGLGVMNLVVGEKAVDEFPLLGVVTFYLAFSFYFSWAGLPIGVPLAIYALKRGLAGWGMALAAGLAVGGVIAVLLGSPLFFVAGPVMALIYWLALRLMAPAAFRT